MEHAEKKARVYTKPMGTFATARGGSFPVRSTMVTVTLGISNMDWKMARRY